MILLVFPNQLFHDHPGLSNEIRKVALLEDPLFFGDIHHPCKFHQQKLWLHRASMKRYGLQLKEDGRRVTYIDHDMQPEYLKRQLTKLAGKNQKRFVTVEPNDFLLKKRLNIACSQIDANITYLTNPMFYCEPADNEQYRAGKKRWFMADYYKWQRKRLNILMDDDEPVGGKWSFDEDNRKKIPKKLMGSIPPLLQLARDSVDTDAVTHVQKRYSGNPGTLENLYYPTSRQDAEKWLKHFVKVRLTCFGDYEDAILEGESWLWHSVLTPMLNIGLLTPNHVINTVLNHAAKNEVPLNSLEGFIRQIIGWREFMRATYQDLGVTMRTTNHWGHVRKMPDAFYTASTGITPIDDVVERLISTGYCHHIERLMVIGGFMFLCEIDPDDIYRWFMEMFIDSYDWVMVPNVYAMSQNADGGNITTKPYFSGSAYVRKMSHYRKGEWCDIWDALYWRWINQHREELAKNPRWAMMCAMARKMDPNKMKQHQKLAEEYLQSLN